MWNSFLFDLRLRHVEGLREIYGLIRMKIDNKYFNAHTYIYILRKSCFSKLGKNLIDTFVCHPLR